MVRVSAALAEATTALERAHVPSARVDAELLAAHVLGIERSRLALAQELEPDRYSWYCELVDARATRVPLQHLTGAAPFRHVLLAVGPGVFVPRPETELLVEWGLTWLRGAGHDGKPIVADLCAGSGAIGLAVATEYPAATVFAVESDPTALRWLRRNAYGHQVSVVDGDVTDPKTLAELDGSVDLVLCNPPYVPEVSAPSLPAEVSHDPHGAVFAGVDGLDVIRPLVPRLATMLRRGGAVGIEHDDTQSIVVSALLHNDGHFEQLRTHHDLNGRPRFTTAVRVAD
jgi:release factor glutamine methyltransferase